MIKNIVFATNNLHKLKELREIVGDRFNILGLKDIGCYDDIPETADTLEGNSLLKASYVKEKYGYDCFADDTGLEVKMLDNAPGVYSARFAGEDCNPENNIKKVLDLMNGINDRSARFRTVFSLILNDNIFTFDGEIKGRILNEKKGAGGFGYDSIFVPENSEKTFAEMSPDEKNKISHRGRATIKLIEFLNRV
jgi:non-canonical purine NTP pyrophosphatase, rdgB/HAM1 family